MDCKQIRHLLLTNHLDNEMNQEAKEAIRKHLESCQGCRTFEQEVRASTDAAFKDASEIQPPEAVWQKINQALDEEASCGYESKPERFNLVGWLKQRICGLSIFPRPAYAFVTVVTIVITFFVIGHLSFQKDKLDLESFIDEQAEFIFGQVAEWEYPVVDLGFEDIIS